MGIEAVFENGKAAKSCFVDLDIEKAIASSFEMSDYLKEALPKFDRKDISTEKLKVEEDYLGGQKFTPTVLDCSQEWYSFLPAIIGEDEGKKFTVKVNLGDALSFLSFN